MSKLQTQTKICENCLIRFALIKNENFCSKKCFLEFNKKQGKKSEVFVCSICLKEYKKIYRKQKYCSKKCYRESVDKNE